MESIACRLASASNGRAAGEECPNAEVESWWVEDVLARAQVSGPELLSQVPAGPRAAVGRAEETRSRRGEAQEHIAPEGSVRSRASVTKKSEDIGDTAILPAGGFP